MLPMGMAAVLVLALQHAARSIMLATVRVATAAAGAVRVRPAVQQAVPVDDLRRQARDAAAALEQSSEAVQTAGVELARVAAAIPVAERAAAQARGALA